MRAAVLDGEQLPSQLTIAMSRSSDSTRRDDPGGSSETGQMSMLEAKVRTAMGYPMP